MTRKDRKEGSRDGGGEEGERDQRREGGGEEEGARQGGIIGDQQSISKSKLTESEHQKKVYY